MWGLDVNITDDFFKASFSHLLKFGFSEKATKFEKIFVLVLTRVSCSVHATVYLSKSLQRVFQIMWKSCSMQTLRDLESNA